MDLLPMTPLESPAAGTALAADGLTWPDSPISLSTVTLSMNTRTGVVLG